MSRTLQYYQENTEKFAADTVTVKFDSIADRFLKYLSPNDKILDFGCGSGRDTRYFLDQGYQVEATDGSPKMCACAEKYTQIPVSCMLFQELESENVYDGIWACASILHVPKRDLPDIFRRMIKALKKGGILYVSFKYGEFEGFRNERYFTDFTVESFEEFREQFPGLELIEEWITGDAREGRSEEQWINIILRRQC